MTFRNVVVAVAAGCCIACSGFAQENGDLDALLNDLNIPAATAPAAAVDQEPAAVADAEITAAPVVAEEVTAPAAEPVVAAEAVPVAEAPVAVDVPAEAPVVAPPADLDALLSGATEVSPAPAVVEEVPVAVAMPEETEPVPVVEAVVEVAPEAAVVAEQVEAPVVEAEPAPEGEAAPASEAASLLAQQEEVRRQAREKEGRASLDTGLAALKAGQFDAAIIALQEAQGKLPLRKQTKDLLEQARTALGEARMAKAEQAFARGDLKTARAALSDARSGEFDMSRAEKMDRQIGKAEMRAEAEARRPVPVPKRPAVVEVDKSVDQMLKEGRAFLEHGRFDEAESLFERVLLKDEYNIDAMRFLRKVSEQRFKARSKEREATQANMIQQVRDAWNPPVKDDVVMPASVANRAAVEMKTSAQKLQEKMEDIIIPSIEFRQANITDVINFLVEASIAGDKQEGSGVNIILNLGQSGGAAASAPAPAAAPADDFGGGLDDFGSPPVDAGFSAPSSDIPTITLNLRRISLLDAIKYITEVARLKFRLEENAVIITPEGVFTGRMVTRMYPVQPSILDVIVERDEEPAERGNEFIEMGSSRTKMTRGDVKEFFEKTGVPFPAGTSITYNPTISQLIVANSPENLEVFERILARLNVIPNQVEIEARFVEVSQDDLNEFGFQWYLTDDWEIAKAKGSGSIAGSEQIVAEADSGGFSKGLRFFGNNGAAGSIAPGAASTAIGGLATFASKLTNPEMSVVINALSQKGGSDLLSAPRVTTRSGVNATIKVVREIIYPTEFATETAEVTYSGDNNVIAGGSGSILVYPDTFETREVGVILNVTPTVGPDGYTIDLVMVPEVAELVDWIQYGYVDSASGDVIYNTPQPVFASRNVTTSIVIWDGQTVVMGGLIREDLVKYEDKVPLLGDIPLIGRLFRSEGEYSQKKNLLIFVTARLVDPAGKPINRAEDVASAEAEASGTTPPVAAP